MNPGDRYTKLDCIDNSTRKFDSFNELWASQDDPENGERMNAIVLANASASKQILNGVDLNAGARKPISGFYSLNGVYCPEFSEFLAPSTGIQAYKVDAPIKVIQQESVGSQPIAIGAAFPLPSDTVLGPIRARLIAAGKRYPTTVPEMNRCPLLLRAAMVFECKTNRKKSPIDMTTSYVDETRPHDKIRCNTASSAQIHIRLEQIFQVAGENPVKTIDSIYDQNRMGTISIDQILKGRK
jgi:hypothetical protein